MNDYILLKRFEWYENRSKICLGFF